MAARVVDPVIERNRLTLLPLIAATYMMVAGGPFGLEDLVGKSGYAAALAIMIVTPLVWSLPTALMVGELASAIPEEGGFYVWVRRAMGPFWGFQEAWLSLVGSVFEMALYPALIVAYLEHVVPGWTEGSGLVLGVVLIAICTAWNILGARAVGNGSVALTIAILPPFGVVAALAIAGGGGLRAAAATLGGDDFLGGVLIAMWNYMGWDNASTVAREVQRPQRAYPLAMAGALGLVMTTYLLPVAAVAWAGVEPSLWTTGGWVDVARVFGGPALALAIAIAGVLGAVGTFNALTLSFTRLPVAMAHDGFLPRVFTTRHPRTGAPWVAIVACAVGWALALPLGFVSLAILDVLITGLSIVLEFWALIALRRREPDLPRPYRVPGGLLTVIALSMPPQILIALALVRAAAEETGPMNGLTLSLLLVAAGPIVYWLARLRASPSRTR